MTQLFRNHGGDSQKNDKFDSDMHNTVHPGKQVDGDIVSEKQHGTCQHQGWQVATELHNIFLWVIIRLLTSVLSSSFRI